MRKYIPDEIESKWQKKWKEDKVYTPDLDNTKTPFYALMMFPYPSAEGLHVGNMYAFTGVDIVGRFNRMQGKAVFEPIGLDGFGIHSENYALKINQHPFELSKVTEKRFYEQLMMIGNGYDWTRTVETYKSNYYKWTQWLFLQMYKKGLAYRKKQAVNFCPSCLTVLADEQVIAGECERCGSLIEQKELEQWFFKITDFAERLLNNLETLDWSEKVKIAQRNWIGKSEGIILNFDGIKVFTTRPDTTDGATFLVLAPEHPLVNKLTTIEQKGDVESYTKVVKSKSDLERKENRDKTGVFTGTLVKNPVSGKEIPVWIADYVLMGYGTGAIMAVPFADDRDREFAEKFNLPIEKTTFKVTPDGEKKINYHLRDWLISRQRYWGPPIPIIYCDKCGVVPVPEEDLPVELPYVEDFRPKGTGQSPLATDHNFYNVKCPSCNGSGQRETDVSDTFFDSSWYFLRYPSTEFDDKPFDATRTSKWLPVDIYIGGAEHSVLHLLYARFITMVLYDLKLIDFDEPFNKFIAHGLIIKDGAKMSKSKGNVVNPDDCIKEFGADVLRMYLMFMGPYIDGGDFRDGGMNGTYHFLQRVWSLQEKLGIEDQKLEAEAFKMMHKTIKKVTEDIEGVKFNTAIAALMEWLNHLSRKENVTVEEYRTYLLLLAPFAPHITEELWEMVGEKFSIHQQSWPKFDTEYLEEDLINVIVQINGKVRDILMIQKDIINSNEVVEKLALSSEKISKFTHKGVVKKIIYIPGKIINFVTIK